MRKILIEVRHPHHVHVFKNLYFMLQKEGCEVLVLAINKEVVFSLLDALRIPYLKVGENKKGMLRKLWEIFSNDLKVWKIARKFKPDILIGKASPSLAHVGKLIRRPYILFTDTENAKLAWTVIKPFATLFVSPHCFKSDFGERHIRFNGYLEQAYLHKNYYKPDQSILDELGVNKGERYSILRFVSWNASHDVGHQGVSFESKIQLVKEIEKYTKVYVSSESVLPAELEKYRLKTDPVKILDVMAGAYLYIGEGATMASECVMMGTPAIYVNSLTAGTIEEQEKTKLLYSYRDMNGVIEKALEILKQNKSKEYYINERDRFLSNTIDITRFMKWLILDYPHSLSIVKDTSNIMGQFK